MDVILKAAVDGDASTIKQILSTPDGHLIVRAQTESLIQHISEDDGQAFAWTSRFDSALNAEIIAVQNTSGDKLLHIRDIVVGGDTSSEFTIHVENAAPGGTNILGVNLRAGNSNTAEVNSLAKGNADVTGLTPTTATRIGIHSFLADTTHHVDLDDAVILEQDRTIYVTLVTASGTFVWATIRGSFEDK